MSFSIFKPDQLIERYDALLIDAYGVLVNSQTSLPGARDFLAMLRDRNMPFRIVTNDASRLETTTSASYARRGLDISPDEIITSGSLLVDWVQHQDVVGTEALVLGPEDCSVYAERAGLRVRQTTGCDVLVIGDEAFTPFLERLDDALTAIITALDAGNTPLLVCPNPDKIYPKTAQSYGFAAGAIATMFEEALLARCGYRLPFHTLGKPNTLIFEKACDDLGTRNVAMLGDQLATDILGANRFGVDAYLSLAGVTSEAALNVSSIRPTGIIAIAGQ